MWRELRNRLGLNPFRWWNFVTTYPRFLGCIKPDLMVGMENEIRARLQAFEGRWEVSRLSAPIGKRLLAITPHPDDEAIGPGGLLLAHRGKAEVHLLNIFDGSGGGILPDEPGPKDALYLSKLVEYRGRELEKSAKQLGCTSVQRLNFINGSRHPSDAQVKVFRDAVLKIRPDIVLMPWFLDGQEDHRFVNRLFALGCANLPCMVLAYEIWTLLQPNAVFDIEPYLSEKLDLVSVYRSQNEEIDYPGYVQCLARFRGFHQGGKYRHAGLLEAYFALPGVDYAVVVSSLYGSPLRMVGPQLRSVGGVRPRPKA